MELLKTVLSRLRDPKTLISLVVQVAAILVLFGVKVDENAVMAVTTSIISILASMGLLSHPEKENMPWDAMLICTSSGKPEPHVLVNGEMICKKCGALYPGALATREDCPTDSLG